MFIIVAMAFQYGDVYRLFYATDYQGATCGVGSLEGFNYGYYPTLADDVLKAVTDNSCDLAGGSCTLSLFTVCVDSSSGRCPSAGDVVCTYAKQAEITAVAKEDDAVRKQLQYKYAANHDNCWFVAVNMTQKFYRCVPWPDASESIVTDVCQEYNANGQLVTVSKSKSECAGAVTETKTSVSMTTGGADELLFTVASYTYYVQELFADLVEVWWVVALVGAGLSVVSSFTFILMLSYVAGCMVWLIIIAIWIAIGFCASFLFLKGGSFFTIDLTGITATASNALTSSDSESVARLAAITGVSQNYAVYYEIAGYVLFFFFASYFCLVCCLSKQIQLCIAIMKSSGNFIGHMKAVPFFRAPALWKLPPACLPPHTHTVLWPAPQPPLPSPVCPRSSGDLRGPDGAPVLLHHHGLFDRIHQGSDHCRPRQCRGRLHELPHQRQPDELCRVPVSDELHHERQPHVGW